MKVPLILLMMLNASCTQGEHVISNSAQLETAPSTDITKDLRIIEAQMTMLLDRLGQQETDNQRFPKELRKHKQQFQKDLHEQKQQLQKDLHMQKEQFTVQLQKQTEVSQELRAQLQHQEDMFFRKLQEHEVRIAQLLEQHKDAMRTQTEQHCRKDDDTVQHYQPKEHSKFTMDNTTVHRQKVTFSMLADDAVLEPIVSHMAQQMTEMTAEIQSLKNVNAQQDSHIATAAAAATAAASTSYIRWGHTACPGSAELVHTGVIGGVPYTGAVGPANHLCLTTQTLYDNHPVPAVNGHGWIFGSEYDVCPEPECNLTPACAAFNISRTTSIMISGTNICPSGWTTEYSGQIMGGHQGHSGSSEYLCVDSSLGYYHSSQENNDENILCYVTSKCGALPCPPYDDEKIVACVTCSK